MPSHDAEPLGGGAGHIAARSASAVTTALDHLAAIGLRSFQPIEASVRRRRSVADALPLFEREPPAAYLDFLVRFESARFLNDVFYWTPGSLPNYPTRAGRTIGYVQYFYGVQEVASHSEETVSAAYRDLGSVHHGMLPIADGAASDVLFLSMRPDDFGAILLWDRLKVEVVYHPIASDFLTFLRGFALARDL